MTEKQTYMEEYLSTLDEGLECDKNVVGKYMQAAVKVLRDNGLYETLKEEKSLGETIGKVYYCLRAQATLRVTLEGYDKANKAQKASINPELFNKVMKDIPN
jgi:hypothetical protein